jgi:hypothetical protein
MPNLLKQDKNMDNGYSYNVSPLCACVEVVWVKCTVTYPDGSNKKMRDTAMSPSVAGGGPWPVSGYVSAPFGKEANPDNLKPGKYSVSCEARFRKGADQSTETTKACPAGTITVK